MSSAHSSARRPPSTAQRWFSRGSCSRFPREPANPVKRGQPVLRLKVTAPTKLRQLKLTLPKQLRGSSGLARVSKLLAGGKSVRKPSLRMKGRTLTIKLPKAGTRTPDLRLRSGALRIVGKLKVGQRVTFTVTGIKLNGRKVTAKVTTRGRA